MREQRPSAPSPQPPSLLWLRTQWQRSAAPFLLAALFLWGHRVRSGRVKYEKSGYLLLNFVLNKANHASVSQISRSNAIFGSEYRM